MYKSIQAIIDTYIKNKEVKKVSSNRSVIINENIEDKGDALIDNCMCECGDGSECYNRERGCCILKFETMTIDNFRLIRIFKDMDKKPCEL